MGHKLIVWGAVVGMGAVAYLRFPLLQTVKFNLAENLYQTRLARAEVSHGRAEEELATDMEAVLSGEEKEIPEEIEQNLAEEGRVLGAAQTVTGWQQDLGLPATYREFLGWKQRADETRTTAYRTWQRAVLTWVRMREVVAQFETTRKKVAQTTASWKEEGVTRENINELRQSLDEMDNLRSQVDKLTEEDTLTRQLVAFFEQAFSDFAKMRQAIEAFEKGEAEKGEGLVGTFVLVKGEAVANKERLLSDWVEEKLAPQLTRSRSGYEEQEKVEARLEMMRETLKGREAAEAGTI